MMAELVSRPARRDDLSRYPPSLMSPGLAPNILATASNSSAVSGRALSGAASGVTAVKGGRAPVGEPIACWTPAVGVVLSKTGSPKPIIGLMAETVDFSRLKGFETCYRRKDCDRIFTKKPIKRSEILVAGIARDQHLWRQTR